MLTTVPLAIRDNFNLDRKMAICEYSTLDPLQLDWPVTDNRGVELEGLQLIDLEVDACFVEMQILRQAAHRFDDLGVKDDPEGKIVAVHSVTIFIHFGWP